MTNLYFISNAEITEPVVEMKTQQLSEKGTRSVASIEYYLEKCSIDVVYSSPYTCAVETIRRFAQNERKPIMLVDEFREMKDAGAGNLSYEETLWRNKETCYENGESFCEAQDRFLDGVQMLLSKEEGKNIVISTHAFVMGSFIQYFDSEYRYKDYQNSVAHRPFILKVTFDGEICIDMQEVHCAQ